MPTTERGQEQQLYQCPDFRKLPFAQGTELVSSNHFCTSCMKLPMNLACTCPGTRCRRCFLQHSALHANHSQSSLGGQSTAFVREHSQVRRQNRSASCPPVQQRLPASSVDDVQSYSEASHHHAKLVNSRDCGGRSLVAYCLVDSPPRVLPRVLAGHEELFSQLPDISSLRSLGRSNDAIPEEKRNLKPITEQPQFGHKREIDHEEVDALPHFQPCHPVTNPANPAPKFRTVFEASRWSKPDVATRSLDLCIQETTSLRTTSRLSPVCADIERMFRQILVQPSDQLFWRIWWHDTVPSPEIFELSNVPHDVDDALLSPSKLVAEGYQSALATPATRDSTEDHCTASKDDLRKIVTTLLKPSNWRTQLDRTTPVRDGNTRDWQKFCQNFSSVQFRDLTSQIFRYRRYCHLRRIGLSRLRLNEEFKRRKHGLSMAAGPLARRNLDRSRRQALKCRTEDICSRTATRRTRYRTKRRLLHPPLLYGTICCVP